MTSLYSPCPTTLYSSIEHHILLSLGSCFISTEAFWKSSCHENVLHCSNICFVRSAWSGLVLDMTRLLMSCNPSVDKLATAVHLLACCIILYGIKHQSIITQHTGNDYHRLLPNAVTMTCHNSLRHLTKMYTSANFMEHDVQFRSSLDTSCPTQTPYDALLYPLAS